MHPSLFRALLALSLFSAICISLPSLSFAQAPRRWTSDEIEIGLEKMRVLGSVLYVAAHPDDENTRLISFFANERKYETTYLSLTRGDGGQNLIGTETGDLLGVLRTQELLEARRIDGGKQLFSRANDFGFSKNTAEALSTWNKDSVLSDVVWAIRKTRPDVIITRFHPDSDGQTHGHHTASARLAMEAFDLAGNPDAFPDQLAFVEPWQPRRIFFNTSWFFYGSKEKFDQADKSGLLALDMGVYLPMKGASNNEIAAWSRSKHRCQGFGSTPARGSDMEYLDFLKGDKVMGDPMEGIATSWARLPGAADIDFLVDQVLHDFDHRDPSASIPALIQLRKRIQRTAEGFWKKEKLAELDELIIACAGMYAEVAAAEQSVTPGQDLRLSLEMTNRGKDSVRLESVQIRPGTAIQALGWALGPNQKKTWEDTLHLPADLGYSNPYWLNLAGFSGLYHVPEQTLRGLPETPRSLVATFGIRFGDELIEIDRALIYKKTDPSIGEQYKPIDITPPVFVNLDQQVLMFASESPKTLSVVVSAGRNNLSGKVSLKAPTGWRIEPAEQAFNIALQGGDQSLSFNVFPPSGRTEAELFVYAEVDGKKYNRSKTRVVYEHIAPQLVLRESKARIVRLDLKKYGQKIAYLMGAGDEMPHYLRQIGYTVDQVDPGQLSVAQLRNYDALIIGIRAYNTVQELKYRQGEILKYVEEGGTVIVQYNTSGELVTPDIGPYPFKISRDRVTREDAAVSFLMPDHAVLNKPNLITANDFVGWVQERGLYFPNQWDPKYEAILSCADPGEEQAKGGLLIARSGKGYFVYTGYAWFRELPAGVPGAYRLFANMISLGKSK